MIDTDIAAPRVRHPRTSTPGRPARWATALLAAAMVVSLLAGGCSSSGDATPGSSAPASTDRSAALAEVVDTVLGPNLRSASAAVDAAATAATTYCAAPTPTSQAAALTATDAAIDAYERLDPVDMGPIMVNRTDGQVAYPVDVARLTKLIEAGPPTDVETVNERTPASTRGLLAAEYLLGQEPAPGSNPAVCGFLVAISANAAAELRQVVIDSFEGSGGTVAYFSRLTGGGDDGEQPHDVFNVIVNMAMTVLDSDAGLLADPGDVPEASVRRATASHLATIAEVWGSSSTRLGQLVDPALADRVAAELQAAFEAVDDPSVSAADARAAVEAARATIGTEVVSALDIVVGFSENDGDS